MSAFKKEALTQFKIMIPVFLAQIAQTSMGLVDTMMTGHYSSLDMAAVSIGSSIWMLIIVAGAGCLMALTPLTAQSIGAGDQDNARKMFRQGMWLMVVITIPLVTVFYFVSLHLAWFGLEPQFEELAQGYLQAILWGVPGLMVGATVISFVQGHALTRPSMILGFIGLALNIPCNYILIYGKFGFPSMGAVGCGVASSFVSWVIAIASLFYLRFSPNFRYIRPIFAWGAIDRSILARLLSIGVPAAFALLFEVALYALSALLIAPLGTTVVAGYQISVSVISMLFMVPLSISITVSIRVGFCLGENNVVTAKLAARVGLLMSVCVAIVDCILLLLTRHGVASLYTNDPAVLAMATFLLIYGAVCHLGDSVQAIGMGALRGYNDTRFIMCVCFIIYWCLGLPLAYTLGRTDYIVPRMGAAGFMLTFMMVICTAAVLFWLRLHKLYQRSPQDIQAFVSGKKTSGLDA